MKIISRYLAKTIIMTTSILLFMLTAFTAFIFLISETRFLDKGYTLLHVFAYVGLNLAYFVYLIFPFAMLLGIILGLALLERHHELVVLRASGMSLYQITRLLLQITGVMVVIITGIGEYLSPQLQYYGETRRMEWRSNGQALIHKQSTWVKEGKNFLYIRFTLDKTHLRGITRYEFDNKNHLITESYADSATYENKRWIVRNIVSSYISPKRIITKRILIDYWPISLDPHLLSISIAKPDRMSLKQLYDFSRYLQKNQLNSSIYRLTFWQRVMQPISVFILVLIVIPFSFDQARSNAVTAKVLTGIVIGLLFYALNQFLGPFTIIYEWPPYIAAILPSFVFSLIATFLLLKMKI